MKKQLKVLVALTLITLLMGCAVNEKKYDMQVLTTIPNQSMEGKTYGLFPLDESKARKIETQLIADEVVKGLALTGLRLGELNGSLPNYIILFDYATDLGLNASYEHVFLIIAYQVSDGSNRQIYKLRLKMDSNEKNLLIALNALMQSAIPKFPNQVK